MAEIYLADFFETHETAGPKKMDDNIWLGDRYFSSQENAQKCIDFYKSLQGFRDYPQCFKIYKIKLDRIYWEDGFIKGMDIPCFALNEPILPNETPLQYAKRLCDKRYGEGEYTHELGSVFNEIKQYAIAREIVWKSPPMPILKPNKKQPKYVYELTNIYEQDVMIYSEDIVKNIGVFSTMANANKALSYIKKVCGFRNETPNQLEIRKYKVDNFDTSTWGFSTGFVKEIF